MMNFEFSTAERIVFGQGCALSLVEHIRPLGRRVFICASESALRASLVLHQLLQAKLEHELFIVGGEPSVCSVEEASKRARAFSAEVILGIGGGSAIDTAKVVSAMATNQGAVLDYLEIIGQGKSLEARPLPLIVIPTTSGTGAEVTKNAVLGASDEAVKVSMRHTWMTPRLVLLDPELSYSLPQELTLTTGFDALTQLIEAFVSCQANPLTDALCREGLMRARNGLQRVCLDGTDEEARQDMALASLLSGMALANAKLGAVHGFAGPMGGMTGSAHGAICAALLAPVTRANIDSLREEQGESLALNRFRELAVILTGCPEADVGDALAWIRGLAVTLEVAPLRELGLKQEQFAILVEKAQRASSMKGNPVELNKEALFSILEEAF